MRLVILASLAALAAACTQETPADPAAANTAPAGEEAPVQVASAPATEGQIDWAKAQADFTAKRPADAPVLPQSVQDKPSPVPMLLPSGIVQTASDRPTPPVVTKDGYFATYHLPRYDAIVNGSMKAYTGTGQAATGDKEAMKFTLGEAVASLAFSRYGADYLIDFECREIDGPTSCITEAEAKEFAESLFVAQTR
ncbi:MAG TPA: hypothetical protein PLH23_19550 [Hyphomonadaceae bacterium]|nr:hypothetical protein [Hyphomonadaceae bacterium]HPI50476.1 hypothetical protein [Hyphomonadaceae bacterium]